MMRLLTLGTIAYLTTDVWWKALVVFGLMLVYMPTVDWGSR